MKYLNLFEKIKLIGEVLGNNVIFILALVVVLIMALLYSFKIVSKKVMKLVLIGVYLVSLIYVLVTNFETLSLTFDKVSNVIFTNIYFPSVYVYIALFLGVNLVAIYSCFNLKIGIIYKKIHKVVAIVIDSLFLLLLQVIGINKINILENSSIYTNEYATTLLEVSTSIFIVWVIAIGTVNMIQYLSCKLYGKQIIREPAILKEGLVSDEVVSPVSLEVLPEESLDSNVGYEDEFNDEDVITTADKVNLAFLDGTNDGSEIASQTIGDLEISDISDNGLETNSVFNEGLVMKSDGLIVNEEELKPESSSKVPEFGFPFVNVPVVEQPVKVVPEMTVSAERDPYLDFISNLIPVEPVKEVKEVETTVNEFTLDDYKLFSRMLQTVKANNLDKQQLSLDDMLSLKLLNKYSINEYNLFKRMLKTIK